jgi:hypothetical protein
MSGDSLKRDLLVLVLDFPASVQSASTHCGLLESVLVFGNAHLATSPSADLCVLSTSSPGGGCLYPPPQSASSQETPEDGVSDRAPSGQMYPPLEALYSSFVKSLQSSRAADRPCRLSSSLSRALCCNDLTTENQLGFPRLDCHERSDR